LNIKVVQELNKIFNNCINKAKINTVCLKSNQLVALEHDRTNQWYRGRVLKSLPGQKPKDEFGNLQRHVRLIDTGEILQELEKDLQVLDNSFDEEHFSVQCFSIQIIGGVRIGRI
jgi:hypothetical protein